MAGVAVEPIMMDQDAILLLSMLESQINLWGRAPDVICELQVASLFLKNATIRGRGGTNFWSNLVRNGLR